MPTNPPHILPFLIAALVLFAVYRRIRRNFGKQLLRPVVMGIRIALLLAVAASLTSAAAIARGTTLGEIAGLCAGLALGAWGASRTRYFQLNGRLHYLPHTYAGLAVTAVFLGRLFYRFIMVYAIGRAGIANGSFDPAQGFAPANMVRSPFTVAIIFVLVGYYLVYYSAVLYKSRHLKPEDIEPMAGAVSTSQR